MKRFFCLCTVLLSTLFWGQKAQIDTTQVVVPNRINSPETLKKPYVILISSDGYRWDYTQRYDAKNIKKIASQGVRAKSMIPSYPSITFPNHWSLITGLYPSHHGLVDNFFFDYKANKPYAMNKKEDAENGKWYGGVPLWALAEKQGMLSASLHWVGCASDASGTRPTYYYHYFEKFTPSQKVDKVIDWLRLPEQNRPHFITLYFPETDATGHFYGPESEQMRSTVQLIDKAVGRLIEKIDELKLPNVNIIFLSDHGMTAVDVKKTIVVPEVLQDKSRFDYFNSQTLLRVKLKDSNQIRDAYKELKKNRNSDYRVFLATKFPKRLHYGAKDDKYGRIGDILLVPNHPKIFVEKNYDPNVAKVGKHGYDPRKVSQMRSVFYAMGAQFKNGYVQRSFENVNVYPLIAHILGLEITNEVDGSLKVLKNTLK